MESWSEEQRERDRRVTAAHAAGDFLALLELYAEASAWLEAQGAVDEACFFGTQAYVLALAEGSDRAPALHARLVAHGREE